MGVPGIPPYEVFATDTTLLCFDGRVLEVFGFNDTHRYHVWQELRLEFNSGRRPQMTIVTGRHHRHTFSYDPHQLDGLRALADLLARSRPEPPSL